MEAVHSYGGRYAVLTVQAGCGFVLYPSNATLPGGARYNYTIRESSYGRDLVREFVDEGDTPPPLRVCSRSAALLRPNAVLQRGAGGSDQGCTTSST